MVGTIRGVEDVPIVTGFIFYFPPTTQIVKIPTSMQTAVWTASVHEGKPIDESISFNDKDNMQLHADLNISYQLDPSKAPAFYVQFRNNDLDAFTHGYLRNVSRDAFTNEGSKYSFDELNGVKKEEFIRKVEDRIFQDVAKLGIIKRQFGLISALRPPPIIQEAVIAKQQAVQKAQQTENELRTIKAEAAKVVAKAEGEAKANNVLTASITPTLMEWRRLTIAEQTVWRWNGKTPDTVIAGTGGVVPMLPLK
jgi:regulator of protease activity HflC (stomatin/prohibitin superfamily)